MKELQIFKFDGKDVRIIDKDDNPWWVAKDVCEVLGIQNITQAVNKLDADERAMFNIGRQGEVNIINEPGLYSLILTSRKPEAKKFKRWITHEVLPAIRKTGQYNVEESYEQIIHKALLLSTERVKQLENKAEEDKPKVEFFDQVTDSTDAIEMADAAKVLHLGIGRNRLFELLRENKILRNNNTPYQQYIDKGYFRVIEQKFNMPDGSIRINLKTIIYQKGLSFIKNLLQPFDIFSAKEKRRGGKNIVVG